MQELRALLIEDEIIFTHVLAALVVNLRNHRINLDVASTFAEAADTLLSKPYDLVFLDLAVPGLPGGEGSVVAIKQLTDNRIPILVVTGGSMTEAELSRAGLTRYLPKVDISVDRLDEEIELALKPAELKVARLELVQTMRQLEAVLTTSV